MAGFCLKKEYVDRFLKAIHDGTIEPTKMVEMTSAERRAFLEPIVGKAEAPEVNRLFEQKVLTKDIQATMVTWAKQVAGLKPRVRQDVISRIERMDERILNPADEKSFLQDLAAQKLGANVTFEEVQKVNELVTELKAQQHKKGNADLDTRLEYGRVADDLQQYIAERKLANRPSLMEDIRNKPLSVPKRLAKGVAGNAKAIQASMDNSAIFRQGWKALWTSPTIWAKNSLQSFRNLTKYRNQEDVMHELNADIMSRPTYDLMQKAKLDVGVSEEVFPTTLPEKIPLVGRVYKATENAYTAFVRKTRADIFDKYIDIAKNNNVELNDAELQSIGKMVNSLTGRGDLGKAEAFGSTLNTFFFSPKMLKSQFDVLTQPVTGAGGSNFVRKQATINLLKMAAGTAAVLGIAKMIAPNSVELDPRSSDFGKIKVGNTRFDVTGGLGSVLVLLSRVAAATAKGVGGVPVMSMKSTTTGQLSDLTNPAYGKDNTMDVMWNFFENKFAPAMQMAKDFYKGETFDHKKPTIAGETINLFTPLPVKTLTDLLQDPEAQKDPRFVAFAEVMDLLGVSTNTQKPWPKGAKQPDIDLESTIKALNQYLPVQLDPTMVPQANRTNTGEAEKGNPSGKTTTPTKKRQN